MCLSFCSLLHAHGLQNSDFNVPVCSYGKSLKPTDKSRFEAFVIFKGFRISFPDPWPLYCCFATWAFEYR